MLVRNFPPRCGNPLPVYTPRACILSCSVPVSVSAATLGVSVAFVDAVLRAGVDARADVGSRAAADVVGGCCGHPCSVLCCGYYDGDVLYSVTHCVEKYCTVSCCLCYVPAAV